MVSRINGARIKKLQEQPGSGDCWTRVTICVQNRGGLIWQVHNSFFFFFFLVLLTRVFGPACVHLN